MSGMERRRSRVMFGLLLGLVAQPAAAQTLANPSFELAYDATGIRSLKRTSDVHDTDYIAANGALGRLLIRYRTTRQGDWRELRDMLLQSQPAGSRTIRYTLGTLLPTLAARSTGGAAVGAAGVRALNDGLVPIPAGGRGRGGGPGPAGQSPDVPAFTWSGSRGPAQWVQYTFPGEEEVARVDVFWTIPPQSWRLV